MSVFEHLIDPLLIRCRRHLESPSMSLNTSVSPRSTATKYVMTIYEVRVRGEGLKGEGLKGEGEG